MESFGPEDEKFENRIMAIGCVGAVIYIIIWLAVMGLVIWGGYELIQYLRRN